MKNPRTPLSAVLIAAWQAVIRRRYNTGGSSPDINSEAALQAYFFVELIRLIEAAEELGNVPKGTRIFVEPTIPIPETKVVIPDLVICRASQVIAVIELKYLPRFQHKDGTHKGFAKDVESLRTLFDGRRGSDYELNLAHARFQGDFSLHSEEGEVFSFSRNTLFVWAGVYSSEECHSLEHFKEISDEVPVLELVATTSKARRAECKCYFGGNLVA